MDSSAIFVGEPRLDPESVRRSIRTKWLEIDPAGDLLSPEDRRDFIDGICSIRTFEGQTILDYTRPWGTPRG